MTQKSIDNAVDLTDLELLDREELISVIKRMMNGGLSLNFHGKRTAMEISKKVRPRVTRRIKDLHVGSPEDQSKNILIEGENLQAMVTLYKFRGNIDLILTDPPCNTGNDFRYNDRWDEDPNDPDLEPLVSLEDGSRHTKWMKFMWPRLQLMKAMLKPSGVLAICIDHRELYRLGSMLDEIFGEKNRIGIINWQKAYSPKSDSKHISTATEYVLVYAKDIDRAKTGLEPRTEKMNSRFSNPDNDPKLDWDDGDATAASGTEKDAYGIQSPFTGEMIYPGTSFWRLPKATMKALLESWGSEYEERDIGDDVFFVNKKTKNKTVVKALVLKGCIFSNGVPNGNSDVIPEARRRAQEIYKKGPWPKLIFLKNGDGSPRLKRYLTDIRQGKVSLTWWAEDDYEIPIEIDSVSWPHKESGHSQTGINELDAIVGKGHGFKTVKPLKLIQKIIHLWCPPNGLVLDPFAGSGTTGHAVLELNKQSGTDRRFILTEQGRPEKGDSYARSLTADRLRRVINGDWVNGKGLPLGGGFEFRSLTGQIDAKAVLLMQKDELVDVVITSHWDNGSRNCPSLIRIEDPKFKYLVGKNQLEEGYFIIWNNGGPVGQLDIDSYELVLQDAKKAGVKPPYNVYARYEVYQSRNVHFYKIPDKILSHLGLNESSDPYNEEGRND